jgi:hypothetical protein
MVAALNAGALFGQSSQFSSWRRESLQALPHSTKIGNNKKPTRDISYPLANVILDVWNGSLLGFENWIIDSVTLMSDEHNSLVYQTFRRYKRIDTPIKPFISSPARDTVHLGDRRGVYLCGNRSSLADLGNKLAFIP